jgi:hypothetical protein
MSFHRERRYGLRGDMVVMSTWRMGTWKAAMLTTKPPITLKEDGEHGVELWNFTIASGLCVSVEQGRETPEDRREAQLCRFFVVVIVFGGTGV